MHLLNSGGHKRGYYSVRDRNTQLGKGQLFAGIVSLKYRAKLSSRYLFVVTIGQIDEFGVMWQASLVGTNSTGNNELNSEKQESPSWHSRLWLQSINAIPLLFSGHLWKKCLHATGWGCCVL